MHRKLELEACGAGMVPRHTHSDIHACFVFDGSMNDRLFGDEVIGAGNICLNPAGTEHWIEAGAEGLGCAILTLPASLATKERTIFSASDYLRDGSSMIARMASVNPAKRLIAEGALSTAIVNSIAGKTHDMPSWLDEARACIDNAPGASVVSSLANDAGVHRATLTRWFQAMFGMSPERYRMLVQLEHAAGLLMGGHSPAHVALEVGFADQAHFNRALRHHIGGSPGQWAKSHATIVQDRARDDDRMSP